MSISTPHPMYTFRPGDLVKLTAQFLKSTDQLTGPEGEKEFKVQAIDGDWVVTDHLLTDTSCWTPEELEADHLLKFRRIHSGNLFRVGTFTPRNSP